MSAPLARNDVGRIKARTSENPDKPLQTPHLRRALRHATGPAGARLKFWGVRGSIASPGSDTAFYGGNTSCVEVRADGETIILDAGTGIRPLGLSLMRECHGQPLELTLLLSHTHWDHIQGLPFFTPAYDSKNTVRILGHEGTRDGLAATLGAQMAKPYFPVTFKHLPAHVTVEEVRDMNFTVGRVSVQAYRVNHPGICVGYRLNTSGGSIVFVPDVEPLHRSSGAGAVDAHAIQLAERQEKRFLEFIHGADVLIMDSQYDAAEYESHVGWGHACVDDVVNLAVRAEVRQLFLFHHDPTHNDARVSRMLAHARRLAVKAGGTTIVQAAREGLEVALSHGLPHGSRLASARRVAGIDNSFH